MKISSSIDLAPLQPSEWDSSLSNVLTDMKGAPINVHKLMAHNPVLLQAWWNFRNYSVNGGMLGPRLAELVILRVGVQLSAWYEWGSHVDRSLKCGLTLDEINAVSERKIGAQWSPKEATLLAAVDELLEQRALSNDMLHRLDAFFDTTQMLDIIAIHGMYLILGCMINTWGLNLDQAVNDRIKSHSTPQSFAKAAQDFHAKP